MHIKHIVSKKSKKSLLNENILFKKEDFYLRIREKMKKLNYDFNDLIKVIIKEENKSLFEYYKLFFYLEREFHFELFFFILFSSLEKSVLKVFLNEKEIDFFLTDEFLKREINKFRALVGK